MRVEEALVRQRMVGVDARKIEEKLVRWNEYFVLSVWRDILEKRNCVLRRKVFRYTRTDVIEDCGEPLLKSASWVKGLVFSGNEGKD